MSQPSKTSATKSARRKPYEPPAVREEKVFERRALQAGCNLVGGCDPYDKLPS